MYVSGSIVKSLVELSPQERQKFLANLSDSEALALFYDWKQWARTNQISPEGNWSTWLCLAGRGWGKSRTGAEWIRDNAENHPDKATLRMALVGATASDVRKVMVEGESGILAVCPPWNMPSFNPSLRQVTWKNGAIAILYSADEPDRLRGPQHHKAWADELAAWGRGGEKGIEAWDNLQMGLRLGDDPQVCVTTTPRPVKIIRDLKADSSTVLSFGSTFENAANVAKKFLDRMIKKYAGSRLGRQELYAEVLDDVPGALWTHTLIDRHRVANLPCDLVRVVIGVDPAVTSGENSDSTGIVVVGMGENGHAYVLRDLTLKAQPIEWAKCVCKAFTDFAADRVVCEVNNGGDLVESVMRSVAPHLSYKSVHASRGKRVRAEPIAAFYEQGIVHHVMHPDIGLDPELAKHFDELENEMCEFVPDQKEASPDRMDALVWALTELYLEPDEEETIVMYEDRVHISPY